MIQTNKPLAQFTCPLDTLRDLMGLPEGCTVEYVQMTPHQYSGVGSIRIVVASEEFPAVETGAEIPTVVPTYEKQMGAHKFTGWE